MNEWANLFPSPSSENICVEVSKLETSVGVEKLFSLQYSLVVCVIWLCIIHWGKGEMRAAERKGKHKGGKDLLRQ